MQNMPDFRAAPTVNRLIVVAHDKQIAVARRKKTHDLELHRVGILKLVDVDITELARVKIERVFILRKQILRADQKVVEIERVILPQVRIVLAVNVHRLFNVPFPAVARQIGVGVQPQHFRLADMELHRFEQSVLVLEPAFLERLLHDGRAFLLGINRKVCGKPRFVGKSAQHAHAHRVNGAYPHARNIANGVEPFLHFVRRLVGKGDRKHVFGIDAFFRNKIGNTRSQNARLAASRPRQHQNRALGVEHGFQLFFI